ncbi:hypothetical protein HELRODRAFT_191298 [Helobdella robusta]|uniref:SAM domain-containing protein n=1 Tax=Helobdella robusta TaxID=6412 RepID=T1FSV0_HELRO|nr:hypothetical protein HELRODRAFT_191298 [Helobdella robusta]ESO05469.1 hypothetical protein HELRODRAFT_191298 [Helobdella robusta]
MRSKVRSCSTGLIGYLPMSVIRSFENQTDNTMESGKSDQEKLIARNQIKAEIQQQLPEVPRKPKIATNGAPIATINISEKSSPEDVKHWLACKGFSQEVQSSLSTFGGKEIFVMDKNVLVKLFGPDVGVKLFSQILVQKNISGYKTLRVCELNAILEVRKKKSDRLMVGEMFNSQPDNPIPDVDHF